MNNSNEMTMTPPDFYASSMAMTEENMPEKMMQYVSDRILMLEYEVERAKVSCFDARNDEHMHWTIRQEKEVHCQVLIGKLEILNKIMKEFKEMTATKTMVAA